MVNKIAVDASWLGPTGIGRVAAEVLNRCPSDWTIVEIRNNKKNAAPLTPFDLSKEISRSNADVFWSPGFMPPFFYGKTPVVLTIHDLTHLHYYKVYHRLYYNYIIKKLVTYANLIITVSDFSKSEFLSWSGMSREKVVRIYNGVSNDFSSIGNVFTADRPYILYVGNRRSYKNVLGLMRAFAYSTLREKGFILALSGDSDEACQELESQLGLIGSIYYLGFIPESQLSSVYRGAHALAFVSFYEGFGLPVLEAMACGIPVLTSTVSSLPETAGEAALLVDPTNIEAITIGLESVCLDDDLRRSLIAKGLKHASMFSWDKTARQYWNSFSKVLNNLI
jgi:glycosyltransferase involved in cell wall biosynthesis